MTVSKRQLALLWTAKSKVRLSDEDFRVALVQLTGCASTRELDRPGFEVMMGFMEWLGFKPLTAEGPNYGNRPGMASFAQIELIRALWRETDYGAGGEGGLNTWLRNKFGIDTMRFLTADAAPKAITALKAIKQRQVG